MADNSQKYSYISSQDLMTRPDLLEQVLDTNPDEKTIVDIMETLPGRMEVTTDPFFFAKIANSVLIKSVVASVAASPNDGDSAGDPCTVTVDAAATLPKIGDVVSFGLKTPTKDKLGIVTAVVVGTPSFTIRPLTTARTIGTPVADDEFIAVGSAHEEGSSAPDGTLPTWYDTKNVIQIFKDYDEVTDLADATKLEFKHGGSNRILFKMQMDLLTKHRAKIAAGLLMGLQSTTVDGTSGKATYTTQGLYNYIAGGDGVTSTQGGVVTSLAGSAVTLAKVRATSRALDKVGAPKNMNGWVGGDWYADFEDEIRQLTGVSAGGINYNEWGGTKGKAKMLELGVEAFKYLNRQWNLKIADSFDKPEQFASKGFADLAGSAIFTPNSEVKTNYGKKTVQRMRLRHMKPSSGGTYIHDENLTGRMAPGSGASTKSVLGIDYETIMGLECLGINHFALMTKA